jgi:hypothetical protein
MNAPGHRLQWSDLPRALRDEITGVLGSAVVEAVGQRGGYSPSLAARCGLADGRRVFIKAVSPAQNPDSPGMMRRGLGDLDADRVAPVVTALAGYFAERGRLPDPPGLPTVRAFQRAQGEVTNAWLRRLWNGS